MKIILCRLCAVLWFNSNNYITWYWHRTILMIGSAKFTLNIGNQPVQLRAAATPPLLLILESRRQWLSLSNVALIALSLRRSAGGSVFSVNLIVYRLPHLQRQKKTHHFLLWVLLLRRKAKASASSSKKNVILMRSYSSEGNNIIMCFFCQQDSFKGIVKSEIAK